MRYTDHFRKQTITMVHAGCLQTAADFSILRFMVFLAAVAMSILYPVTAPGQTLVINDATIKAAVENRLETDADVSVDSIDVTADQGVITLSGNVHDLLEKDRAVMLAQTIKGVTGVIDLITLPESSRADQMIRFDIEKQLNGDPVNDLDSIAVAVTDSAVTVSGSVDSYFRKQAIARHIKNVRGVTALTNDLTVILGEDRSDTDIKKDVQRLLDSDPYVNADAIDVEVRDGSVRLRGKVGSAAEKSRAFTRAFVAGAATVDAVDLHVDWKHADNLRRRSPPASVTDEQIKHFLENAFSFDPRVNRFNPSVTVENGRVTLDGRVTNLTAKRAAETDAWNTRGVRQVTNRLRVRFAKWPEDDVIDKRIKDVFKRDVILSSHDILVKVIDNKVFLYGVVNSAYQKIHAEVVASQIQGVIALENHIRIDSPWVWQSDTDIEDAIRSQLFWSPFVYSDELSVSVVDGEATLKGKSSGYLESNMAIENAFEGGARSVRITLELSHGSTDRRYYPDKETFDEYRNLPGSPDIFW